MLLPLRQLALVLAVIVTLFSPTAAEAVTTTTRVATFNALGHSHTTSTGKAPWRLDGVQRTRLAVKIFDYRKLDIIALQEFQRPQQREFRRVAGDRYGLFCPGDRDNCVAWRRAEWRLEVRDRFFIPYFHGNLRPMPHTVLVSKATGAQVSVTSVHNPCSCYGPARQWRVQGWEHEAELAERWAQSRRVLLMGDRNARADQYLPHIPGSFHPAGTRGIDFIVGSRGARFSNYRLLRTERIRRATDHPLVYADVALR